MAIILTFSGHCQSSRYCGSQQIVMMEYLGGVCMAMKPGTTGWLESHFLVSTIPSDPIRIETVCDSIQLSRK